MRLMIISFFGLIILAVWTYPYWRSQFMEEGVRELFPGLAVAKQTEFARLSPEEQRAYYTLRNSKPELALALVNARFSEPVPAPEEEAEFDTKNTSVVRRASFTSIDPIHQAEGDISIYQFPDGSRTLRLEVFSTFPAPDLHLILTTDPQPTTTEMVGIDYIDLGELKGTVGNQNYQIPDSVDFSRYRALALYSISLQDIMSVATLR